MFGWRRDKLKLGFVVFELTDACNQACKFCYNHFKGNGDDYPVESPNYRMARRTLKRLLREAEVGSLSMSGGEPMLMPKIHELILRARFAGCSVNMLTNGTLLTVHDIAIFRDIGVNTLQIPILADDSAIHDSMTQLCGSWRRATNNARRVAAIEPRWLTPVLILSRMNVERIEPTLDMYAEMGCRHIMVNRFNIGGQGRRNAEQLMLTHDELRDAFHRVDTKAGEHGMSVHSGVCTPHCVLNPKEYRNILFTHCTTDIMSRPLTVNYRGDVRFCNHSPRVLGNIHKEPLAKILARCDETGYFATVPEKCNACQLWESCKGGCRAAAEQVYGTFTRRDPIIDMEIKRHK